MQRRPLIAGNWKMHLNRRQAVELARGVAEVARDQTDRDIMIAPAFTALAPVSEAIEGERLFLGAQNVGWEKEGAFTGEVSAAMLTDLGVGMVIIGHSERRHLFHEDDAMINRRLKAALAADLAPILCLGETLEEREAEQTFLVLGRQLREAVAHVSSEAMAKLALAYEPVWAIGTGKTASTQQAQEAHLFLRQLVAEIFNKSIAEQIRILYGGSVKADNIDSLMAQSDIDGALVGGAALTLASFERIIRFQ